MKNDFRPAAPLPEDAGYAAARGRWRLLAFGWPAACLGLAAFILLSPSGRTGEQRLADAMLCTIPLVFFFVGMRTRLRLLKEMRYAVRRTKAVVMDTGRRTRGGKRFFYPEFQFQAGERTYHVVSSVGYGFAAAGKGTQVELYYAPENPELFYGPALQRRDRRLSALLCGIGVAFPLAGLWAPLLRGLFARMGGG